MQINLNLKCIDSIFVFIKILVKLVKTVVFNVDYGIFLGKNFVFLYIYSKLENLILTISIYTTLLGIT